MKETKEIKEFGTDAVIKGMSPVENGKAWLTVKGIGDYLIPSRKLHFKNHKQQNVYKTYLTKLNNSKINTKQKPKAQQEKQQKVLERRLNDKTNKTEFYFNNKWVRQCQLSPKQQEIEAKVTEYNMNHTEGHNEKPLSQTQTKITGVNKHKGKSNSVYIPSRVEVLEYLRQCDNQSLGDVLQEGIDIQVQHTKHLLE